MIYERSHTRPLTRAEIERLVGRSVKLLDVDQVFGPLLATQSTGGTIPRRMA